MKEKCKALHGASPTAGRLQNNHNGTLRYVLQFSLRTLAKIPDANPDLPVLTSQLISSSLFFILGEKVNSHTFYLQANRQRPPHNSPPFFCPLLGSFIVLTWSHQAQKFEPLPRDKACWDKGDFTLSEEKEDSVHFWGGEGFLSFCSPWCCFLSLFFQQTHAWDLRGGWLKAELSAHGSKPADVIWGRPRGPDINYWRKATLTHPYFRAKGHMHYLAVVSWWQS